MADPSIIATPLRSPVAQKSWIPQTPSNSDASYVVRGPPVVIGVGSVTINFIWTRPPGGAISLGMCSETCGVLPPPPLVVEGPGPWANNVPADKHNNPVTNERMRYLQAI